MSVSRLERERPLPDEAYEDLILVVQHADKLLKICKVVEKIKGIHNLDATAKIVGDTTGLNSGDSANILLVLMAFHNISGKFKGETDAFLKWLEAPFLEFLKDHENGTTLESRWREFFADLKTIFGKDSPLGVLRKAFELTDAHQYVLRNIRILTDLRPVYDSDAKTIMKIVLTHQLVVGYSEGSLFKKKYFAIDATDIKALEDECRRARDKAAVVLKTFEIHGFDTLIAGEKDE